MLLNRYIMRSLLVFFFFFSSRRRHTRSLCDWSSDVCSSDLKDRATKENRTYDAKLFRDWRKMFDELGKSIDAVTVSTPDHMHGLAGITAMRQIGRASCRERV